MTTLITLQLTLIYIKCLMACFKQDLQLLESLLFASVSSQRVADQKNQESFDQGAEHLKNNMSLNTRTEDDTINT